MSPNTKLAKVRKRPYLSRKYDRLRPLRLVLHRFGGSRALGMVFSMFLHTHEVREPDPCMFLDGRRM